MRVTFLTYSITGNTKLTAKRIGAQLTDEGKRTVTHLSIVKIGKEVDTLGDDSPLLTAAREAIAGSEVVALGCFSDAAHPSRKVNQVLADSVLPRALFKKMKCFFVFATAGGHIGRAINVLATLLLDKNPEAQYLGSVWLRAPGNWPPLQPERPYRDSWLPSELARADAFGAQIARYLSGAEAAPRLAVQRAYAWSFATTNGFPRSLMNPKPECVRAKCQRCGTCARKCPYNAIRLSDDIEDGFPVFDLKKCFGCGRCFNTCPAEAIEMPSCHSELRTRYPRPNLVPPGEACPDGAISQPLGRGKEGRRALGRKPGHRYTALVVVLVLAIIVGFALKRK
jgi:ferredoxin